MAIDEKGFINLTGSARPHAPMYQRIHIHPASEIKETPLDYDYHHTVPANCLADLWNSLVTGIKNKTLQQYAQTTMRLYLDTCNIEPALQKTITDRLIEGTPIYSEDIAFSFAKNPYGSAQPQKMENSDKFDKEVNASANDNYTTQTLNKQVFFDYLDTALTWQTWNIVIGPGKMSRDPRDDPQGRWEAWDTNRFSNLTQANVLSTVLGPLRTAIQSRPQLDNPNNFITLNTIFELLKKKLNGATGFFGYDSNVWHKSSHSGLWFHHKRRLPKGETSTNPRLN